MAIICHGWPLLSDTRDYFSDTYDSSTAPPAPYTMDDTKKMGRNPSWVPEHSHYYSDQQRAVFISMGMRVRKAVSEGYKTGPKPQQPQSMVIATTPAAAIVNANISLDTKQQQDATPVATVMAATVGAGQHQTLLTDWYEPVSRKRAREEEKDVEVT
ncbi:hypothetical protein BC937DRAFT_93973 [Endogone sp. FLAS-F59071]|nr:hypothetical protein BC937DRAFT_93973 [Endogone sp. FLAS-F59071]|eukprot:RUS20952.1 hypothetical protein BC937DRAFT_93973 [Endogone sp. FLAS-F59071]